MGPVPRVREIAISAAWHAGEIPSHLVTTDGQAIEVVHRHLLNCEPQPARNPSRNEPLYSTMSLDPVVMFCTTDWRHSASGT